MNLWRAFEKMVQTGGPLQIGEVVSVQSTFADQRCTVQLLPGTAQIQVIGTGRSLAVGQRWVIRDGKIIDEAPSGTIYQVEI